MTCSHFLLRWIHPPSLLFRLLSSPFFDGEADEWTVRTGYIGEFEIVDDHRSGKIVVQLNGRLNKTGVISPRYNIAVRDLEKWVNLLLPARGFGYIILVRLIYLGKTLANTKP